jgi:hypothetical protein
MTRDGGARNHVGRALTRGTRFREVHGGAEMRRVTSCGVLVGIVLLRASASPGASHRILPDGSTPPLKRNRQRSRTLERGGPSGPGSPSSLTRNKERSRT